MYSHFKIIAILFLAILFRTAVQAQPYTVTISIAVLPPYYAHIDDYIEQPNKIMATLVNTGSSPVSVYLLGTVTGEGGIRVYTDPAYRMSTPINLSPQGMYYITRANLEQIFSADNLKFEGITKEEVFTQNGLPEGDYQICLRAYEYYTGVPVSAEEPSGCSAPFQVTSIEPPVILQPVCGTEIVPVTPQQVVFSWTRPPNAPVNTRYQLKIIEVLPSDRNINDAMQSSIHPVFYQQDVAVTNYLFGPADPALVEGKTYAFAVTAYDPTNKTVFRNNGMSEVCSFDYKKTFGTVIQTITTIIEENSNLGLLEQQFKLVPRTLIKGRLLAKYPNNPGGTPSAGGQGTLVSPGNMTIGGSGIFNYGDLVNGSLIVGGNVNNTGGGFWNPGATNNEAPMAVNMYGMPMLSVMNGKKYVFEQTENLNFTKPLPNTLVQLVVRVAVLNQGKIGQDMPSEYGGSYAVIEGLDLQGNYRQDGRDFVNVVLASAYTDAEGNYTFDFQAPFFTGPFIASTFSQSPVLTEPVNPFEKYEWIFPGGEGHPNYDPGFFQNLNPEFLGLPANELQGQQGQGEQHVMMMQVNEQAEGGYLCLKVEVGNQKFCSPDIDIFAMPGATMDIPVQVARLKTYDLTVEVRSSSKANQLNGSGQPLAGVNVSIFRDTASLQYEMPLILNYEGQKLTTNTFNNDGEFKNVSLGMTDANGKALFRNLVRHDQINPQYLISLKTRDISTASTYYDKTFYNYEDLFLGVETNSSTNAVMKSAPNMVYNHEYTSPTPVTIHYVMEPLNPEIKGRVMVATNLQNAGLTDVPVYIYNQGKGDRTFTDMNDYISSSWSERGTKTNASAFFRFINLPVSDNNPENTVRGPYRRIDIHIPGYKRVILPPLSEFPYNLSYGQLKDVKDINLEPEQMLAGYVEDEDGKPVPSYVKSSISPYFKTVKKIVPGGYNGNNMMTYTFREIFEVPAVPGGTQLTVAPLSSEYFSRDTTLSDPSATAKVVVYKRLHRPLVTVRNQQGDPLQNVLVEISGNYAFTDSKGTAKFKFPAADDQFVIRIGSTGEYTPLQEAINIPVSPGYKTYAYVLKKAKSISGRITDKSTGNPIQGAMIYSELKQTDGIPLYLSATSDDQGNYELKGIPSGLAKLTVHVVREGNNPTYEGVVQELNLNQVVKIGTKVAYNFMLTPITGWILTDIWGFPVTIEKFTLNPSGPEPPQTAKISGYFHNPPGVNGFSLLKPDQKLPFEGLDIVRDDQGKAEPTGPVVTLQILDIPVSIQQTFTGHLTSQVKTGMGYNILPGMGNTVRSNLTLSASGILSQAPGIRGQVEINLNSFKIANDFKGDLYMGDDTLSGKAVAFAGKAVPGTGDKHYIFSLGNSLVPVPVKNYRVFGFNSDADLGLSVLEGKQVRLRTILHTVIPGCATCAPLDLKIRAGDVVISGTQITFEASPSEKLNFQLEKWKVYSQKDWTWDKNEESIILPEVLIVTGKGIDAKVLNMKIRPTSLTEGSISLNGGLTLGGIAELVLSGTLKPIFNYDQGIGHYRISLVGQTDQPAATVYNLPNTSPATLQFKSIGLLSNDDEVLTIGQKYRFFDIIDMYVDQMMSGPGFFKLNGQPDPGIPHFTGQSAVMSYTKTGNKLTGKMEPIKGFIECNGGVEFYLDEAPQGQSVKPGVFTAYGNVKINPGAGQAGNPVYLRGILTKTNDSCTIRIIKVDNQGLYAGGILQKMIVGPNVVKVLGGSTLVQGNAWSNLTYVGSTSSMEGLDDPDAPPNYLYFEVKGAVDVSSSSLSVTNIDTPLGSMSMVYNFDEPSFTGTLTINNLDMGFAAINYGMMGIRFDPKGFYLCFVGEVNLSAYGQYAGGFIVGSTASVLTQHSGPLLGNFTTGYRPGFANGGPLKGFYAIGERIIVDKSFNLVVTVDVRAGLGAYVTADFSQNPTFIVGGYGYAKFKTGVDIGLCCFCMCTGAMFDIHGGIDNGNWVISNCAMASLKAEMCVTTLEADFKMDVGYSQKKSDQHDAGLYIEVGLGSCGGGSNAGPCD